MAQALPENPGALFYKALMRLRPGRRNSIQKCRVRSSTAFPGVPGNGTRLNSQGLRFIVLIQPANGPLHALVIIKAK